MEFMIYHGQYFWWRFNFGLSENQWDEDVSSWATHDTFTDIKEL